jgi:hypothetical protein
MAPTSPRFPCLPCRTNCVLTSINILRSSQAVSSAEVESYKTPVLQPSCTRCRVVSCGHTYGPTVARGQPRRQECGWSHGLATRKQTLGYEATSRQAGRQAVAGTHQAPGADITFGRALNSNHSLPHTHFETAILFGTMPRPFRVHLSSSDCSCRLQTTRNRDTVTDSQSSLISSTCILAVSMTGSLTKSIMQREILYGNINDCHTAQRSL